MLSSAVRCLRPWQLRASFLFATNYRTVLGVSRASENIQLGDEENARQRHDHDIAHRRAIFLSLTLYHPTRGAPPPLAFSSVWYVSRIVSQVEETCSGAVACQLVDSLFPGKVDAQQAAREGGARGSRDSLLCTLDVL